MNLQWHHIELAPDDGYCIRIKKQKTETEATLAISYEAYKLGGEQDTGKVFKGLERSMTNYPLKRWIRTAGITKHIAFHCFQHTYALLQLSMGTDISTTQIYADLINAKKRKNHQKDLSEVICL